MEQHDRSHVSDELLRKLEAIRPLSDGLYAVGFGMWRLIHPDGSEETGRITNLITQVGDEYYGERAAGIASPPAQVTGMRLGTSSTAPAKTGAGAAIVTYVTASHKAIDGGFPTSSLVGGERHIIWQTTYSLGEATADGIVEAVITNETPLTNVAGTAANTIARGLLSPVVNKGALDTLIVGPWSHEILGS